MRIGSSLKARSLGGARPRRLIGEGGHDLARKAPEARAAALAAARSAAIDQHITDPDAAQLVELLGDLVGRAIDRAVAVHRIGIAGRAIGTALDGAVGPRREPQLAPPVGQAA